MSSSIYIKDAFGNRIPLLDSYGNISFEVVMLYSEDKLSAEDRKVVEALALEDEMTRDVLSGYAKTGNSAKTYQHINQLSTLIEERTGAERVSHTPTSESGFDVRRIAAAVAMLLVVGTATYFISQQFKQNELADNEVTDPEVEPVQLETESDLAEEAMEVATGDTRTERESAKDLSRKEMSEESRSTATEQIQEKKPVEVAAAQEDIKKLEGKREEPVQKSAPDGTTTINADQMPSRGAATAETTTAGVQNGKAKSELMNSDDIKPDRKRDRDPAKKETESAAQEMADNERMAAQMEQEAATNTSRLQTAIEDETSLENAPAKYPGGDMAMYKFIEKKKNYTDAMKAQNIKGKVTVIFEVDEAGRVQNAAVKSGINGLADEDALRVVRSMPKWKPATENGVAVPSNKTVVIRYGE
jgi:TonB family protein